MLTLVDKNRKEATAQLNASTRGALGQFMTPSSTAKFLASLFEVNSSPIHLLDAGAGAGSLTAAFLDRLINHEPWGKAPVKISAFEIDPVLLPYYDKIINLYSSVFKEINCSLNSMLNHGDFIEIAVKMIADNQVCNFSHAILNPPYKKINSQSRHRKLLSSIGFETVNLYSAFVGLSIHLLKEKGELVAIIPRSFCNGNYYKGFRKLIVGNTSIRQIHLFDSRDRAFKDDAVLQENIVIHLVKGASQGNVLISKSTDDTFNDLRSYSVPFNQVIKSNDDEIFIHIPEENQCELESSKLVIHTLEDLGISISTGPVVDFRVRDFISHEPNSDTVPLLYPSHFNCKEIDWPKNGKKPNAIVLNEATKKMLYPSGYYTVVKRFSSKEEKQRVVARVINPEMLDSSFVGIENHLNVFHHKKSGISEDLAYGLAAYLNSSFVDTYFRSFNGHTQVNATDLKQMRYPSLNVLKDLGKWAKSLPLFDQKLIDEKIEIIL
ncbi:Eco57I restriction-modification methylase domain-containing protein [Rurimicrobium arvi]|uniref:site-specific DNA-methyltransferase (adenine-specific) n=1 Tax=Rurimicrobium arvi TaxID=2049916 RepID=A0ABP8N1V5_9BACT